MKSALACIVVVLLSWIVSQFHMIYTADQVAKLFGYVISIGLLPVLLGGLIGCIAVALMNERLLQGIKVNWYIPVIGSMSSLIPIAYVLWRMAQPEH
jgi:hypothetical protein